MSKWISIFPLVISLCLVASQNADAKNFVKDNKNKSKLGNGSVGAQSGLQYKDLKIGKGAKPTRGRPCTIHYTGWLYPSGKKFDSSVDRGIPFKFSFGTSQVMKGWNMGISTMKVGGKRILLIPPELGHGKKRVGPVPPNSTLKYEIELLKVK